jgi:hypothetical protein
LDGPQVEQAQHLGALDGPLEAPAVKHLGEVEEGAGDGSAGDAVVGCAIARGQRHASMDVDAGPGSR